MVLLLALATKCASVHPSHSLAALHGPLTSARSFFPTTSNSAISLSRFPGLVNAAWKIQRRRRAVAPD